MSSKARATSRRGRHNAPPPPPGIGQNREGSSDQTADQPISYPQLPDLPENSRADRGVQEKRVRAQCLLASRDRPDEFRAFFAYHDALMEKPGNLTKAEREMIVVATSRANQCQYCVVAHGAILRIRAKDPLIADQLAINYRKADLASAPARDARLRDAGLKALESHNVDDAALERLRAHGFTEDDAWDIAAIAAFFALSNRLANAFSIRPNDEFYAMGRGVAS